MPSTKAIDFLSKELLINKETVTFRWLSRELAVHVNEAKKELESFHASSALNKQAVYATYLLVGDVKSSDETMVSIDVHNGVASRRKILLVGERELQEARSQFLHAPSSHIYSLSPIIPPDVTLLATIADRTRSMDVAKGRDHNRYLGMVVSSDVQIGKTISITEPAKLVNAVKPKPTTTTDEKLAVREVDKSSQRDSSTVPERKAGTLDWSKAKPKQALIPKKSGSDKLVAKPERDLKRGPKRSSDAIDSSDSESGKQPSGSRPQVSTPSLPIKQESHSKTKRSVLVSDDEGLSDTKPSNSSNQVKRKVLISDEDEEDMDPSSRPVVGMDAIQHPQNSFSEADGEKGAEVLSDEPAIPTIPKSKRKPKKIIPVGRNGLPKRKIVKSRKTKNAKGYTGWSLSTYPSECSTHHLVTEDYSSYESISEPEDETTTRAVKIQRKGQTESDNHMITDENLLPQPRTKSGKKTSSQINEEEKNKKRPVNSKNDLNNYFKKK